VLVEIYESFTKESQKPPTAEVVAITRDQSTPSESESATPAETVDATWTDATATDTGTDAAAADAAEPSKADGPGGSV
jgi:hypothetical protein